jgi:hypothetical protein
MLHMFDIARLVQVCREAAETHRHSPLCPLELDLTWKKVGFVHLRIERWRRLQVLDVSGHLVDRDSLHALASLNLSDLRSAPPLSDWDGLTRQLRNLGPLVVPNTQAGEQGCLEIARGQRCSPWYIVTWRNDFFRTIKCCSPTFSFAGCQWRMVASRERGQLWTAVHARDTPRQRVSVSFSFHLAGLSAAGELLEEQSSNASFTGPGLVIKEAVACCWAKKDDCKTIVLKLTPLFR